MASIDEVVASLSGSIQKSDETSASIDSAKSQLDELVSDFQGLSADSKAQEAEQVKSSLEEAVAQQAAVKSKIEEAISQGEALKTLVSNGPGPTTTTSVSDSAPGSSVAAPAPLKHEDMVSGDKLVERSGAKKSKSARLAQAAMKEDATDPARTLAESADRVADAFQREFGPPIHETNAHVEVQGGTQVQAAPPPKVGVGGGAMAAVAISVLVMRGNTTIANAASRWSNKTKEHRLNDYDR